jgi:hypothetical protein
MSGINAGYTMLRGSVKGTGYPLHLPVFPSLPSPVRHRVPSRSNWTLSPTRTETDVHMRTFALNKEFLLAILIAFTLYTLLKMLDIFSLCVLVEESVAFASNIPIFPQ